MNRLAKNWNAVVHSEDTVIIPGDISWSLKLEESLEDFRFLNALPGKKLIGKGNHDFWWSTASKMKAFFAENQFDTIDILYNNAYDMGDCIVCGTRGWFFEEERSGVHDEKVFRRELLRLEASLKAAGDRPKTVFLHYPPRYKGYTCEPILELLKQYDVRSCYYGHLHGASHGLAMEGMWDGIEYHLVAADKLGFAPYCVIP
jgi:predicted phosphohydrolase